MQIDSSTMQNDRREADRHVAAVGAALSLLDCFDEDAVLRLRDLHERTGMQKSRIIRLAGSLEAAGYLVSEGDGAGYRLGPKIMALGQLVSGSFAGTVQRIRPVLDRLSKAVNDTCFFSVVRGTQRVVLAQSSPGDGLCFTIPEGQLRPLHAGATGKVLLAFGSATVRSRVMRAPLAPLTDATRTDARLLEGELAEVRRNGFSVSRGEATAHAYALAVPVTDARNAFLGALTVAGPVQKLPPEQEAPLAARLARELQQAGLSPPPPRTSTSKEHQP